MQSDNQIQLAGLMLQDTGTYNPHYSRPYMANTSDDALSILENRIADVSRADPLAKINGNMISGLSHNLIIPSTAWDHELMVPNGWGTKRLRFCLEVHVDTHFATEIYFFQGYSEEHAVSLQGTIDPRMVFYINSFIRVNRAQDYSGLSGAGFRDVIVESAQIIDGRIHSQHSPEVYGLRPEDLFTGIHSSYLNSSYSAFGEAAIHDDRVNKAGDVFRSRRSNAIPSAFLAKVVESHRNATTLADFGSGTDDIFSRSIQNSYEGTTYENPFIRALSNLHGMMGVTTFTMEDLALLDPTINQRTDYHKLRQTVQLHQTGMTDDLWGNATLETQLATILTQAVSGLMLDCMIVSVAFNSNNLTVDMSTETKLFPGGQAVTTADMRPYYAKFISRFESEVMPDITKNGTIPVDVIVYADLYGETVVKISLGGQPHLDYVTPSFCDALMAPIVTTNTADYHGLVTGIEDIVNRSGGSKNYSLSMNPRVSLDI